MWERLTGSSFSKSESGRFMGCRSERGLGARKEWKSTALHKNTTVRGGGLFPLDTLVHWSLRLTYCGIHGCNSQITHL
jgi:hypothetical protein